MDTLDLSLNNLGYVQSKPTDTTRGTANATEGTVCIEGNDTLGGMV